jgi:putative membrane protein
MKKFDDNFRKALRETVLELEKGSSAEVVVAILPRTQRYLHVPLLMGLAFSVVTLTLLMFLDTEFWYIHIYLDTVAAMLAGIGLIWIFPGLGRMMVGEKEMQKQVEIRARSMFQKAGIHETRHRTGLLVVFSWLEQQAVIVADKGVLEALPPAALEQLQTQALAAIRAGDAADEILKFLQAAAPVMREFLPQREDDTNELPDDLWLD